MGLAVRPDGDLLIADSGNNVVRLLSGSLGAGPTRQIRVLAGDGTPSFAGDKKPPAQAQFAGPAAVLSTLATPALVNAAVSPVTGTRYVLDTFNHALRSFQTADSDPDNHAVGDQDADDVSTLVGNGLPPAVPTAGQPVQLGAQLSTPMGMALDTKNPDRAYIADTFNNVVRSVDLKTGAMTTVAGTGVAGYSGDNGQAGKATLSYPAGVAVDPAGDVFIADTYNGVIREVVAASGSIGGPSISRNPSPRSCLTTWIERRAISSDAMPGAICVSLAVMARRDWLPSSCGRRWDPSSPSEIRNGIPSVVSRYWLSTRYDPPALRPVRWIRWPG